MGKISSAISKFLLCKVWGFKIKGNYAFDIPKKVLIAAPHTSAWDLPLGILTRNVLRTKIQFVGKATLFKPPFGWFFRAVGGVPVDRTKNNNFVDGVAEIYENRDDFNFCLAVEGTRKKVYKLKTGFYYIARKANVPVQMIGLDYKNKQIIFSEPFYVSDNMELEMRKVEDFFRGIVGKVEAYSF
ncbi:1-acyl-sn-glycerol-3-phosphate acyltransferase [Portibacter lacus]|uniref:Acyltransferase n=1 Tax=Portibacter lacus TaxID=1099794 RepID=A0AA37SND6_9BACT|nr:1-acyl-sn-glycerol-3-phosphate acyltransferase [Portibacter lacus]GLR17821.1 acyltransferase [Portibacter lacus]